MGGNIWSKTPWYSEGRAVPTVPVVSGVKGVNFLKILVSQMN